MTDDGSCLSICVSTSAAFVYTFLIGCLEYDAIVLSASRVIRVIKLMGNLPGLSHGENLCKRLHVHLFHSFQNLFFRLRLAFIVFNFEDASINSLKTHNRTLTVEHVYVLVSL